MHLILDNMLTIMQSLTVKKHSDDAAEAEHRLVGDFPFQSWKIHITFININPSKMYNNYKLCNI